MTYAGERRVRSRRWWRSAALDLLGFERQVVYSSLCAFLFTPPDPEIRYGGYAAHTRAMASFCAADRRLAGVALCDLDSRAAAEPTLDEAIDLGCRVVWIPARTPGGRSPGHPDHHWFWSRLAERGVPFVLHVGSGPVPIGDAWTNDGRPPADQFTGVEIIGSKDMAVIHHPIMRFLSVLVLDGVLERHRGLRGGAIEMGAGWVPGGCRTCCAGSTTPRTSGAVPSPAWRRSSGRPRSRPAINCGSRPTRSRPSGS